MSETTTEMLAEIDKDLADIEKAVSALQQQAGQANYPQPVETTTDRLAENQGQAADYTPPEGWRVLQAGEVLEGEDWLIDPRNGKRRPTLRLGHKVEHQIYIRRITSEPEQTITPDDVAAEAINESPSVKILRQELEATELALLEQQQRNEQLVTHSSRQHIEIAELQAQVKFLKGRELTLGTRLEEEKAVTTKRLQQVEELRSEVSHVQRLWGESRRRVEELETLVADLRAVNATTEKAVSSAARDKADLQHRVDVVAAEWAQQAEMIRGLQAQLEAVKAESAKRLETIQELRDEVSQVHRQWGDSRWRVEELEQKLAEPQPEASPVLQQVMIEAQAETMARLNSEIHELNIDIAELETQLESVKAELVQVSKDRQALQIELDAYELRSHNVSDRFEEGWDKGTAQAVETIAEWTEPFRTCGSQGLSYHVMQNLPHIMRTLTGLTDED